MARRLVPLALFFQKDKNKCPQLKAKHCQIYKILQGRPGVLENDTAHQINYEYNNIQSVKEAVGEFYLFLSISKTLYY